MNISELLHNIPIIQQQGSFTGDVGEIQMDSRKVSKGDVFVAISGPQEDGHDFITSALNKGAQVIFHEKEIKDFRENVLYIQVKNSAKSLGLICKNYFGDPSSQLNLIGITGTNGKTTTASLLYQTAESLGYPSVLISTINIRIHQKTLSTKNTTPDIISINKILKEAVDSGFEYAFMEVSSHGIEQERISGLEFKVAGFTNISHEHLDYHKTFKSYIIAKKKFFDELSKDAIAITNMDDKNGVVMLQNSKALKKSYALKSVADYQGKILENRFNGMLLLLNQKELWTQLVGKFNAYNLLLVYSIGLELGWDEEELLVSLSKLQKVKGRFESYISPSGQIIIVDYAHTPDALENVMSTVNETRTKNETFWVLVGCGGNRDAQKRPNMAKVACRLADRVVLTSDNPRNEDPNKIIEDMESGIEPQFFSKYSKIPDRQEAIKNVLANSHSGDIILIAGKGHEDYQEIKGERFYFDDMEITKSLTQKIFK